MHDRPSITPEMIVWAYTQGIFPMARSRHGTVDWYSPDPRAILPLDTFHVPRSLARRVRSGRFTLREDCEFERVIRACSLPRSYQKQTWISDQIVEAYTELHHAGIAHSVEAWQCIEDKEQLVGGLYGVAMGGVFFGESMFSRATDASKVCLVHLVERLRSRGYVILDTQMANDHMMQFGIVEVPREEYLRRLKEAMALGVSWD